jgi:glucosyl-3-phosphoglycerate synthase
MEYVQERVATLHDLTDPRPAAPTDRTAVVIPMTEREYAGLAAERTLRALETVDPAAVVVPLRVPAGDVRSFREWLDTFELPIETVWCNGPEVGETLEAAGLGGSAGKGRDVWLALGIAAQRGEYVAAVDADAQTFSEAHVPRLVAPLTEFDFSKGYYARVENGRLYGRLFRLFYVPLVRALAEEYDHPLLSYLESFRYALAGEFAAPADVVERMRLQRDWGLEVGTLGEAYRLAGLEGSVQVDLGRHEHDHRSVSGPTGLSEMSRGVGEALLRVVEEVGVDPDYGALRDAYRTTADRLVDAYAADARFNRLEYDPTDEREQVRTYVDAVAAPGPDDRLPAWREAPVAPGEVRAAADRAVENLGSE